jgi:head-tail adaptor
MGLQRKLAKQHAKAVEKTHNNMTKAWRKAEEKWASFDGVSRRSGCRFMVEQKPPTKDMLLLTVA